MKRISPIGFTLIEVLIALAIFAAAGIGIYTLGISAIHGVRLYRQSATVAMLAQKYMEIARNLPYAQVGTESGNPHGPLPDKANALFVPFDGANYEIYYVVTYVSDPSDTSMRNDYKQVKLYVDDPAASTTASFVTTIAPQGLGSQSGGALSLQVIDSVGQPVPNATLTISNSAVSPAILLTRTTDSSGKWTEVGLPTSTESYHIVASKSGFSSDQTYPITGSNPNPTKPDATVASSTTTGVSFSIDHTSALTLKAVNGLCQPISGVGINLTGAKLIGTPNVLKFDHNYTTDGAGEVVLSPLEWDNYTPAVTTPSYLVYGSSPIQQINLLPGTSQTATLILGTSTPNSLLVIVKDASTGNPIENATVELSSTTLGYDSSKLTAGSVLYQDDWSGGGGQADMGAANEYYQQDGNVDTTALPTGLRLTQTSGSYTSSGWLESSSFDTGTASSSYTTLTWNPTSQTASTTVKFQVATNNDDATWNFTGPDGTASTYYNQPGTTLSSVNDNKRYLRYKVYLNTVDASTTPVVSNVTVNYVSGCFAPGQAMFPGLAAGNYQLTVSMSGYLSQTVSGLPVNGNGTFEVDLSQ